MTLPITLEDAKRQLQMDTVSTERDIEVGGFLDDAVAWVEQHTGHIFEARNVTEQFDGMARLHLRAWPILPTAVPALSYRDASGASVAVAGARVEVSRRPARIVPGVGFRWPAPARGLPVTVTVRAGHESPASVPRDLRRAMLILIAGYDSDREGGDIFAKAEASARRLCDPYRMRRL